MDDLLAEGLEILDSDEVRVTQLTKNKSQKIRVRNYSNYY